MKAIVVSQLGGPENLDYVDHPEPRTGDGDVLVEVDCAGVNFIDVYHRRGLYDIGLPFIPGLEGAGTVVATGPEAGEVAVGDRVAWVNGRGSYAEQVAIPVERAIPIPEPISSQTAAAMLLQGLTAHYLATDTYPLDSGSTCLIHAGAGGVGLLLTQIARLKGARVITTVGSPEKAELSKAAGAWEVILYRDVDFATETEGLVGPRGVDVVYDGVGAATFMQGLQVLRPRGLMVTFGNASGPVPEISPLLLSRNGSLFLTRPTMSDYLQSREELLGRANDLFRWVQSGDLEVTIGDEYDLADAGEAHIALEARRTTGKVLLHP